MPGGRFATSGGFVRIFCHANDACWRQYVARSAPSSVPLVASAVVGDSYRRPV